MVADNVIKGKNKELWGEFQPDCAGFTVNSLNLPTSWEYIYQNRDVLLKVDQYGPVYAQANPPGDVMIFKRENGQKFSNWAVWLNSPQLSDHTPFTNFFRPLVDQRNPSLEPEDLKISFQPNVVSYHFFHEGLSLTTEFMVPQKGTQIVMKFKVKNMRDSAVDLDVCPFLTPYVNPPQLAPWDKYEWYLKSGFGKDEKMMFWSQLLNMNSDKTKRRTAILWTDEENVAGTEISYEKFIGNSSIACPEMVTSGKFRLSPKDAAGFGEYTDNNCIYAYAPVYAAQYKWDLQPNEEKELTQVLCMPNNNDEGWLPDLSVAKLPLSYFDNKNYEEEKQKVKEYFDELCGKNQLSTGNRFFDYYINQWLALQMDWVASLDRGWPSGMRGTRDSAQDYAALLLMNPKACREVLLLMLSCQRKDGWFPRQYSAQGRKGTHDLRGHVDGGAFVVEFFYQYLSYTQDFKVFDDKLPWLDCENENTVFEHMVQAMEYYITPQNIGEHGLCKIGEGDWLDSVNRAGVLGRGESVMVTNQVIMDLQFMADIYEKVNRLTEKAPVYRRKAQEFKENLLNNAFNKKRFFSSVFNDGGKWLFSDCDPDSRERPYGPANYYSVISGVALPDKKDVVYQMMEKLKGPFGYRLYWPPMGDKPIDYVGRVGSGDAPFGLAENGNVYNHGSQGFLARALATIGDGNELYNTLLYMLPFDQSKHPTYEVMTAPYAIVNCWQEIPVFPHRGMLSFLTGSVAMVMRGVYEWMMGVKPYLDGIIIDPCIPDYFKNPSCSFVYLERKVELKIENHSGKCSIPKSLTVNGKKVTEKRKDPFSLRQVYVIKKELLNQKENQITVIL